jgi:putative heme-binding domain-containing protein
MDTPTKQDILQTLAARTEWAGALLDVIERGGLLKADLSAFTARQIDSLGDKQLSRRLQKIWGATRATPREKRNLIDVYTAELSAALPDANLKNGRALYEKTCAACHTLFDSPPAWGPDLNGANRSSLHYLLENIVDPSASVPVEFQMRIFQLTGGAALSGFVAAETETTLTVQTLNEQITVAKNKITQTTTVPTSIMPEGLLPSLSEQERRDLIGYLQRGGGSR